MFPSLLSRARRPRIPRPSCRPTVEQLEDRCTPSVDPILEWNANAIEVNRVSYSGGLLFGFLAEACD